MNCRPHFDGTAAELQDLVESQGINGKWLRDGEGLRYLTPDGGILLWYGPIIRLIVFQGKDPGKTMLREKLGRCFAA